MEANKFKTNIKCAGCVAKVTPYLNDALGIGRWQIDVSGPSKVLVTEGDTAEEEILKAVESAGFSAEKL